MCSNVTTAAMLVYYQQERTNDNQRTKIKKYYTDIMKRCYNNNNCVWHAFDAVVDWHHVGITSAVCATYA